MRRAGAPLYYRILEIVRRRIADGDWRAGAALPTDEALVKEFGVSRHTVRVALNELVNEGLIERFPGRGSFVVPRERRRDGWSIASVEDLIDMSFVHRYEVRSARAMPARSQPDAARALGVSDRESLFHVRAVRSSSAGPYAYSDVWFPRDIGDKLPRHLMTERPLILLVEEFAGRPAWAARQRAYAEVADADAVRHLGTRVGEPLLVLERTYFDRDERAIEHARVRHRSDRYQQTVTFSRRRQPPHVPSRELEAGHHRGDHGAKE
jgi:GntR family transcriptional regulator